MKMKMYIYMHMQNNSHLSTLRNPYSQIHTSDRYSSVFCLFLQNVSNHVKNLGICQQKIQNVCIVYSCKVSSFSCSSDAAVHAEGPPTHSAGRVPRPHRHHPHTGRRHTQTQVTEQEEGAAPTQTHQLIQGPADWG